MRRGSRSRRDDGWCLAIRSSWEPALMSASIKPGAIHPFDRQGRPSRCTQDAQVVSLEERPGCLKRRCHPTNRGHDVLSKASRSPVSGPPRRRPEDFSRGLAGALRTYASVLEWAGREADAARIRQESEAMTEQRALPPPLSSTPQRE